MMWSTTIILPSDICTNCRDNVIITTQHIHTHARRKGRTNAKKEWMKKKTNPILSTAFGRRLPLEFRSVCVCVYRGWGASFCTWDSHWPGELWGPTFPFPLLLLLPFTLAFALFPMFSVPPPPQLFAARSNVSRQWMFADAHRSVSNLISR